MHHARSHLFLAGTGRYVRTKPKYDIDYYFNKMLAVWMRRQEEVRAIIQPSPAESRVGNGTIALPSGLVVPFNVVYAQMAPTFIVHGERDGKLRSD